MDDILKLFRKLSRQGIHIENMSNRLRGGGITLSPGEARMLRKLWYDDRIMLTGAGWRTLLSLTGGAPESRRYPDDYYYPVPFARQWLRKEPVTRVHKCGDGCPCSRLPLRSSGD